MSKAKLTLKPAEEQELMNKRVKDAMIGNAQSKMKHLMITLIAPSLLLAGSTLADSGDIKIEEAPPATIVWWDGDYPIQVSHDLWLQVLNYGNELAERAARGEFRSNDQIENIISSKAQKASDNIRLQRFFFQTAVGAFNTHYSDITRRSEASKIPEPSTDLIKRLAARNITFDSCNVANDGSRSWNFSVKDPHSAAQMGFFTSPSASEDDIVREAYRSAGTPGPWGTGTPFLKLLKGTPPAPKAVPSTGKSTQKSKSSKFDSYSGEYIGTGR